MSCAIDKKRGEVVIVVQFMVLGGGRAGVFIPPKRKGGLLSVLVHIIRYKIYDDLLHFPSSIAILTLSLCHSPSLFIPSISTHTHTHK